MNQEDQQDIRDYRKNITYWRYRYKSRDPNPNQEETKAHPETNMGKGTMEDREEIAFNILISSLNDLAKGQKEIMEFMGKIAEKGLGHPSEHQNNQNNNGEGDPTTEMESIPIPVCRFTCTYIVGHLDPPFPNSYSQAVRQVVQVEHDESFEAYLQEYKALG